MVGFEGTNTAQQDEVADSAGLSELFQPGSHDELLPLQPARASLAPAPQRMARRLPLLRWTQNLFLIGCKASVLVVLAWGLVFNVSEVRGSSMMPGIHDNDRILVDHLTYMLGSVGRGDVVVMRYPLDPSLDYLKRVVGLPGDEVIIERGRVMINGAGWPEPYVASESVDPYTTLRTIVRPGHYFVLGDNRLHSSDSREFGQVPADYLRGKVRAKVWPLARLGSVR